MKRVYPRESMTNKFSSTIINREIILILLCMKASSLFDKGQSLNYQTEASLQSWKALAQEQSYLWLFGLLIFAYTTSQTADFTRYSAAIEHFTTSLLVLIWALDRGSAEVKSLLARAVYIISLLHLTYQLLVNFFTDQTSSSLNIAFLIMKPLLLASGDDCCIPLVLLFIQYLSLARYIKTLRNPSKGYISIVVYLLMQQGFYRTSHRERFSSIQFGKAFLAFPHYNFCLHAFLIILNTYSSQILGLIMLPHILGNTNNFKRQEGSLVKTLQILVFTCSSIMCLVTKRELMFPQRTAPKYAFDVI